MNYSALLIIALSSLTCLLAEVTVLKQVQVIYDKSPKLRIRGSGFDIDEHKISLVLGAQGLPPLVMDKDYLVNVDEEGDGLILKLLSNRKWVDLSGRVPPVALILSSVKFEGNPNNLLHEDVIVANVLPTPTVKDNSDYVLYKSASNELRINGTGFIGAKKVDIYFDPPLVKEVAYEDVSPYPLSKNQVVLRLRHGYNWREESLGPLSVIGVDTGGGAVKVNGDEGVVVAQVVADLDEHRVRVLDTADTQLIYNDESSIIIKGTGFSPVGNLLRWANGLLGNDVNYTTPINTETQLTLRLSPGSHWRKNFDNLPGTLTLLAVDAGGGFVAVGPTNSGKGRDIATVFERPAVFSGNPKLFRTQAHEVHVAGTGFPDLNSGFKVQLRFNPPLVVDVDYTIRVISRTEMELTLIDGRAWRPDAGSLLVTHINTRGDEAGWVTLPGQGVHIADVKDDVEAAATGGVQIFPLGVKVYQSAKQQSILMTGTGFKEDLAFTFDPPMEVNKDYKIEIVDPNQMRLKLIAGKKWRAEPGLILAKTVKVGDKVFKLGGDDGIRVAVVLADPVITPSTATFHESQSKLIVIDGTGFTTVTDTTITLRPTGPVNTAYKVLGVMDDAIRLQLLPNQAWLPSAFSLKNTPDEKFELKVTTIDTGAGVIVLENPVTVGLIVQDREGVVCDDSCEFAFDGVCDDGSEPKDEYYYQHYQRDDDDLGGFNYDFQDKPKSKAPSLFETKHLRRALDALEDDQNGPYGSGVNDDYYMENEDYTVAPCVAGTDCTDCGGVDALIDYTQPLPPDSKIVPCSNTCMYSRDGVCDDPRGSNYCEIGTDCQDCGPVGADNFTRADDDGWWDDDDDYWNLNDGEFIEQVSGLEKNRHKVKKYTRVNDESPGAMFLTVLEGMVYAVGAIFAAAALYLLHRWYNGQSVPFVQGFNSELSVAEFEMRPTQRMAITPDEFRT